MLLDHDSCSVSLDVHQNQMHAVILLKYDSYENKMKCRIVIECVGLQAHLSRRYFFLAIYFLQLQLMIVTKEEGGREREREGRRYNVVYITTLPISCFFFSKRSSNLNKVFGKRMKTLVLKTTTTTINKQFIKINNNHNREVCMNTHCPRL